MTYEMVCNVADVPSDEALGVTVGALEVAIGREGDEFFALQDLCSHAAVALSEGEVSDCSVECWLHGSRFDLRTGKPTGIPATEAVPVYETKVSDDTVYVNLAGSAGIRLES